MFGKKWKKEDREPREPLTKEQKKKRRKRIIIGIVAAVVLAVFILPNLFAPETLPMVSVTQAYMGSVEQTIEGSGVVKSEEIKTYFSPVSAMVADFELAVGDTVEAGETLLTYNASELDELYRQAELTGSAANYGYQDAITKNNENVSEYNRSSAALTTIEQQLEDEKNENKHVQERITEYSGKQGNAQIAIAEQEAIYKDALVKIEEADALLKKAEENMAASPSDAGVAAQNAAAEAARKTAEASRDAALKKMKEEQDNLTHINEKLDEYQDRLTKSTENLEKLQTSKAREEGIKDSSDAAILSSAAKQELAANNNLSTLNAQMTKDDINAGKAGIQAQFSGVVTEVSVVAGGPVAQGSSMFTVASNENVIVDMSVTRFDLEKLEVGQAAEIVLAGKTYAGTVSRLSRLAAANEKGTPVVSAEIHIEDPDENIYLGLEAKVTVKGHKAEDVLVVPVEAVNTSKEGSFCYVVEDGVIGVKEVETGLSSTNTIEILSGLKAGDQVVLSTGAALEEGMRVMAVEE